MNSCILTLALSLACTATTPQDSGPDATADHWIAEDKLRHFALSFASTQMAYGAARSVLGPATAAPAAAGTAIALGLAKEVADVRSGATFSLRDLAWNLAGVALGVALIHNTR